MDSKTTETEVQAQQVTPKQLKRKQKVPEDAKSHGSKHGLPQSKRFKLHPHSISSTRVANNIMKFRLGGSVSDPLNLEGGLHDEECDDGECSTCAPSPAPPNESGDQPSPLPQYLQRDPLNLEGKIKSFPAHKQTSGGGNAGVAQASYKPAGHSHKRKAHQRRRSTKSEEELVEGSETKLEQGGRKPPSKRSRFCYGNYDRYYGYRNSATHGRDVRLPLLEKEWFENKDCLDIGTNTGQVVIWIGREFRPKKIMGIDIDPKLIRMAWKNLHREYVPTVAPDGRLFPQSLSISRGPLTLPFCKPMASHVQVSNQDASRVTDAKGNDRTVKDSQGFPYNIEFKQVNYIPDSDSLADNQRPQYDTILALSLTKWIHLNWGDAGIKRFFRKVYNHLRPGGRLILEPQPLSSYTRKKKLTPDIFKNYQSISFYPRDFHSYLMSPDVGFTNHKLLGIPDNKSKGFRRPLNMYIKGSPPMQGGTTPASMTEVAPPVAIRSPFIDDCNTSQMDCSSEGKRLKSVVVDVSKDLSSTGTQKCDTGIGRVKNISEEGETSCKTVKLEVKSKQKTLPDRKDNDCAEIPMFEVQTVDLRCEPVREATLLDRVVQGQD